MIRWLVIKHFDSAIVIACFLAVGLWFGAMACMRTHRPYAASILGEPGAIYLDEGKPPLVLGDWAVEIIWQNDDHLFIYAPEFSHPMNKQQNPEWPIEVLGPKRDGVITP